MTRTKRPVRARQVLGVVAALSLALLVCIALGTAYGAAGGVSPGRLLPGAAPLAAHERAILLEVRVPRVLMAAVIGAALTVAGVVFQALLRNPLADPFVLGVSGGASIGGVAAVLLGWGAGRLGGGAVGLCAFAGALGALVLIQWVATQGGRMTVYTVLLTGAIFNAFSAALIYFLQSVASLEQLHEIVFYLMGRIPSPGPAGLALTGAATVVVAAALFASARDFNALALGDEGAGHLGVEVERVRRRTLVLGSLLTAIAVSVAGMIGFVGLVVPHVLRLLLGPDHRLLIPAAFLGGAAFLVLADLAARVALPPGELPVGVVTALIGGPFFLYLLRRRGAAHGA